MAFTSIPFCMSDLFHFWLASQPFFSPESSLSLEVLQNILPPSDWPFCSLLNQSEGAWAKTHLCSVKEYSVTAHSSSQCLLLVPLPLCVVPGPACVYVPRKSTETGSRIDSLVQPLGLKGRQSQKEWLPRTWASMCRRIDARLGSLDLLTMKVSNLLHIKCVTHTGAGLGILISASTVDNSGSKPHLTLYPCLGPWYCQLCGIEEGKRRSPGGGC